MTYIYHVTLNTGDTRRSPRSEVGDDDLAVLHAYLAQVLARPGRHPLPMRAWAHYSMMATLQDGALLVTVFAPSGPHVPGEHCLGGDGIPMVTFGVAQRSRHGGELWALMVAQFGASAGLKKPAEPWCAAYAHPSGMVYPDAMLSMAHLERGIAWAWITRNPALRAADDPR